MEFTLNYDDAIPLDAEALDEGGVAEAYESLLSELRKFVKDPATIEEMLGNDVPSYSVRCDGREFEIYSPNLDEEKGNSWGRATVALFSIVNKQLQNSSHCLYAINGGNDLFGMFLMPTEATAAQRSLPNKRDWPYLPEDDGQWYGQYH